ncbi:pentraxin fusion protein-like [Glandiceps talaboti]
MFGINVATNGSATQSTYYLDPTNANRAIDGDTNRTRYLDGSCAHSLREQEPWWKVDLGKSYDIYEVIVTNRMDCCSGRILNAEVRVGDSENIGENTRCGELVGEDRKRDETLTFRCDGLVSGRNVSIQVVGREAVLNICEVQVMAIV